MIAGDPNVQSVELVAAALGDLCDELVIGIFAAKGTTSMSDWCQALIKSLTEAWRNNMFFNKFLFEWKTSE